MGVGCGGRGLLTFGNLLRWLIEHYVSRSERDETPVRELFHIESKEIMNE